MNQDATIKRILDTVGDLPPMPHIATLIMKKIGNPSVTAKEIQDLIARDQALAARVLRIANSPYYGCPRTVTRLSDAVMVLGFNSIKSLVTTSILQSLFRTYGLAEKLLWEHAIGCALVARKIAEDLKFPKTEIFFLGGLLHDIGKALLLAKSPEIMMKILQEVYNNPGTTFIEIEEDLLGFNHADVGQVLVRKWDFAEETVEAIACHHTPQKATILPPLCAIINLANSFCHKQGIGPTKIPELDLTQLPGARFFRLSRQDLADLFDRIAGMMNAHGGLSDL